MLLALSLRESELGRDHPILVEILNNLGGEYSELAADQLSTGKQITDIQEFLLAERSLRRALSLDVTPLKRAIVLTNLGSNYIRQAKFADAEKVLKEARDLYANAKARPSVFESSTLTMLGGALFRQVKCSEAVPEWKKALDMRKSLLPPNDWLIAQAHNNYARALECNGQPSEAEKNFREAIRVFGDTVSQDHARTLNNFADFLMKTGRVEEAKTYRERAQKVQQQATKRQEGLYRSQ